MWHHKYSVREEMVPQFLTGQWTARILATGGRRDTSQYVSIRLNSPHLEKSRHNTCLYVMSQYVTIRLVTCDMQGRPSTS